MTNVTVRQELARMLVANSAYILEEKSLFFSREYLNDGSKALSLRLWHSFGSSHFLRGAEAKQI